MTQSGPLAYEGVVDPPLGARSARPRIDGLTMVIDKGLGLVQLGDLLEMAGTYIDFIKLGFGTAALYPAHLLRAKVVMVQSCGIHIYPGGTFLEIAISQNRLGPYLERTRSLGFDTVEVSDGTIELHPAVRREVIRQARALGLRVLTEVGKKAEGGRLEPGAALEQIGADLQDGAERVILEGRESGRNVGLYDAQGRLDPADLQEILQALPDPSVLIWEAPLRSQQVDLIRDAGPAVNLGNIAPGDALAVESLRRGLRADTLALSVAAHRENLAVSP